MEGKTRKAALIWHKSVYRVPGSYSENRSRFFKPIPASNVSSPSKATSKGENSWWRQELSLHMMRKKWFDSRRARNDSKVEGSISWYGSKWNNSNDRRSSTCLWFGHACSSSSRARITCGTFALKIVRWKRLFVWMVSRSAIISHQSWKKTECKTDNHIPLVVPGVQATKTPDHSSGRPKQTWAVCYHELQVATELPEWIEPFTEGFTRWSSSSTDVSPADVAIPLPAISLSAHPPAKPIIKKPWGKHSLFNHFPKTRIAKYADAWKLRVCLAEEILASGHNSDCQKNWWFDNSSPQGSEWRARMEIASQICSGCARLGDSIRSTFSMQNQVSSGDAEKSSKILTSRRKPKVHKHGQFLQILLKFAKSWIGIKRDLHRTDQKHKELQNELHDEWKKDLRQCWFSLDCKKAGGQKPWSVTVIYETCMTYKQVARHLMNVGWIHHLMGRLVYLEQKSNSFQYHQRTKVECICSAQKSFLEYSLDTLWTREKLDWWSFDGGYVRSFKSKAVHIFKSNNEFVFPCRTGEILQEGQPSSIAVYKAAGDFLRESQQHFSEQKEAQDPDPDVEARQNFWRMMGD